jgi:hypothetical protein
MIAKLSDEQRRALEREPGAPLPVEDPDTHARYMLVEMDLFERLQRVLPDDGEVDPRQFYAAFGKAVASDLDAPGMEDYDNYEPPQRTS